jgi:hypothetical protein
MHNEITVKELKELWDAGVFLHCQWIGPKDGWEFSACRIGDWEHHITFAKSRRALYNKVKRWLVKDKQNEQK